MVLRRRIDQHVAEVRSCTFSYNRVHEYRFRADAIAFAFVVAIVAIDDDRLLVTCMKFALFRDYSLSMSTVVSIESNKKKKKYQIKNQKSKIKNMKKLGCDRLLRKQNRKSELKHQQLISQYSLMQH